MGLTGIVSIGDENWGLSILRIHSPHRPDGQVEGPVIDVHVTVPADQKD